MPSDVDVKDFGAVGRPLVTSGTTVNFLGWFLKNYLAVADATGWTKGSGIGIAGAEIGNTSFVTRVINIFTFFDLKILVLAKPTPNMVQNALVTSDDSLPIQDALDAAGRPGGLVYFPPGEYTIGTTGAITNQPLVLRGNVTVRGAGKRATTLVLADEVQQMPKGEGKVASAGMFVNELSVWWFSNPVIGFKPVIEIADMTLDGNKLHQSALYDSGNKAITLKGEGSSSAGCQFDSVEKCVVQDAEIHDFVTEGIYLAHDVTELVVNKCWIHDVGRTGLGRQDNETTVNSIQVTDCWIHDSGQSGVDFEGGYVRDLSFANCRFAGNAQAGIALSGSAVSVSAVNCQFDGMRPVAGSPTQLAGVRLLGAGRVESCRIADCLFRNHPGAGCQVETSGHGSIVGCVFDNNGNGSQQFGVTPALYFNSTWPDPDRCEWRIIGNMFRTPSNNVSAIQVGYIGVSGDRCRLTVTDNQFVLLLLPGKAQDRYFISFYYGPSAAVASASAHLVSGNTSEGALLLQEVYGNHGNNYLLTAEGTAQVQANATTVTVQVPGRPWQSAYAVRALFTWDPGLWTAKNLTATSFDLEWTTPAPAVGSIQWAITV